MVSGILQGRWELLFPGSHRNPAGPQESLDPTDPKVGVAVVGDTAPGAPSVLPPPRAGTWGQGTIITCKATAQGCCEGPMG